MKDEREREKKKRGGRERVERDRGKERGRDRACVHACVRACHHLAS